MSQQSQNPMAVEPVPRLMARIGTPIVLSMILQAAYNVVDSAYLARMPDGGEAALTALSLAFPVQLFMVAVSIGTGVGTNALLARLLGQGDREQANRTVGNAQLLAVCITGVFMLFAAFGVRDAITPIVSFNFGMRSRARVQQGIRWGLGYTAGLMLVGCVGVELFAEPLAGLFSLSGMSHALCVACMRIVSLGFVAAGLCIAFQGVFQALNRGAESLVISVCRQVLFVLPPVWALSRLVTGPENAAIVWWPLALGEVVTLGVAAALYYRNGKKLVAAL